MPLSRRLRQTCDRVLRQLAILSLLLLAACSPHHRAPVVEPAGGPRYLNTGRVHRVNSGETLYTISLIYDIDYRTLARINGLAPPYIIRTGEFISVDPRKEPPPAPPEPVRSQAVADRGTTTRAPIADARGGSNSSTSQVAKSPPPTPAVPASPAAGPSPSAATAPRASPKPPERSVTTASSSASANQAPNWAWPAPGPLLARFNAAGSKGIDIGGREGDPVTAAADGEVVYAGGALLRYGEMIILKHNDRFLSAYAHNSKLLVREGERVRRGQKIAELGSTGIDRSLLHFELRLDGEPVDPLKYLPSR